MRILTGQSQREIEVKKSRFVAIACPIEDLGEIKERVNQTRAEHPQANHVVHAAIIGKSGDTYSCSDDHEPKNTAGRPALEVLKGSGITNILVLIVRYFGGTLLGTGGLVKAYADSVKEVLQTVETEELVAKCTFSTTIPYNLYEQLKKLLLELESTIESEEFGVDVHIAGNLATSHSEQLQERLTELSNGTCSVSFTCD